MTSAAPDASAHVLREKPMAMSVNEAAAMHDRARDGKRFLAIDHEPRFHPNRRKVRDLIRDAAIGEVRPVQIVNIGNSWGNPASRPENDRSSRADMGGGHPGANGSDQIDLLLYGLDDVTSAAESINTLVRDRPGNDMGRPWRATADDFHPFTLRFECGTIATVLLGAVARRGAGNSTQVIGNEGTLHVPDNEGLLFAPAGDPFEDVSRRDPNAALAGEQPTIWTVSVMSLRKEFVSAIREDRPLRDVATLDDGLATQRVSDAIRTSSNERRWIRLENEEPV